MVGHSSNQNIKERIGNGQWTMKTTKGRCLSANANSRCWEQFILDRAMDLAIKTKLKNDAANMASEVMVAWEKNYYNC